MGEKETAVKVMRTWEPEPASDRLGRPLLLPVSVSISVNRNHLWDLLY